MIFAGVGQQKTPHPFPGAGFLVSSPDVARRALTRTSVGNEKYEYKGENHVETCADKPRDQNKLALRVRAAGAVAVRHKPTLTNATGVCQLFFWRCGKTGAFSRRTGVRKAIRPDAFAANSCSCNYFLRVATAEAFGHSRINPGAETFHEDQENKT
jgi:hypothetical protein